MMRVTVTRACRATSHWMTSSPTWARWWAAGLLLGVSVYREAEAAARCASGQLHPSRFTAAMQLGEFYVRGGVALDRCVLFL